jgi:hypothetical protein
MMKRLMWFGFMAILLLSCDKRDDDDKGINQENGKVWLSGGLAFCAEQLHLDNGDTLIASIEKIGTLKTGDRVVVKYRELGISTACPPYINCEIIEITKVE